ncbi:hypothetical protein N7450_011421 [Penicillium hetheringtonii]|uniref:Uncharacterized protein n=1 Tax=Penicillium hetheringtonii TaxID=911720 RepID=A0AAD6DAV9_9EURO|nr:hypothetical protein N7450_011421 [Penicillium hetheringtonii]
MPNKIQADAVPELESLAKWVSSAEMKEEKGEINLLACVDTAREKNARPLLKKLGYTTSQGHSVLLLRICGETSIKKPDGRTLLFFPLSSDVQVEGETLQPGSFIQLTKNLKLDTRLDCMIVIPP